MIVDVGFVYDADAGETPVFTLSIIEQEEEQEEGVEILGLATMMDLNELLDFRNQLNELIQGVRQKSKKAFDVGFSIEVGDISTEDIEYLDTDE